jgi:predicted nucleic acid-binding protein
MMQYLLDTNILIYYLNGDRQAIRFVDENLALCAISSITYLEILVYPYSEEEDKSIREFLALFEMHDINKDILDTAIRLYRKKKIKIADNLIASTAKLHNLTLVTRNTNDFKKMDLDILDIYASKP